MILNTIQLKNFRVHKQRELKFSGGLNYIVGGNGLGKTSILESIYYLCTTKSNSTKTDNEAVNFNEDDFEIKGNIKDLSESNVRLFYSSLENKKYYFFNDKQIFRSADVIGMFPVVMLAPADHTITQGPPGERRKFVDSVLSQASVTYLKTLLDYNKTLRQRSSLLTKIKESKKNILFDELEAWTAKLIQSGTQIIMYRQNFVSEFNAFIKNSYAKIMENHEIPEVFYSFLDGFYGDDIEDGFRELVTKKSDEEIRRASNLVGPHRDDFKFNINSMNLKTYGSQGQHKTFQVVLKFAQFFYLKEKTGKTPIFLLDDVFGELDINRSIRISEYLRQIGQAVITLTDFTNLSFLEKNEKDSVIKLLQDEAVYA